MGGRGSGKLREWQGKNTLLYVKQTASGDLLCDNLEAWDGVGDGREVQEGRDIYIPVTDSC